MCFINTGQPCRLVELFREFFVSCFITEDHYRGVDDHWYSLDIALEVLLSNRSVFFWHEPTWY